MPLVYTLFSSYKIQSLDLITAAWVVRIWRNYFKIKNEDCRNISLTFCSSEHDSEIEPIESGIANKCLQ